MTSLFRVFLPPALAALSLVACSAGEGAPPAPVAPIAADPAEAELQRLTTLEAGCCSSENPP